MRLIRYLLLAVSFAALSACSILPSEQAPKRITILHTNDHHGRFWHNDRDEYGLAAQKTLVDGIRKEVEGQGGSVLLFSGGDINTGVPASDMQKAEPDFRGMRMIGYDAMALGNHEFDNAPEVLARQIEWAGFPVLSANIYRTDTHDHAFQPYALFERQGLKIAVIGLTTEDTKKFTATENTANLEFRDPTEEARRTIEVLNRDVHPDVIIAVTHMGHYENGEHGAAAPGDVEMARKLPTGALSMIVGGHSQNPVCMAEENKRQVDYVPGTPCAPDRQNGIWIVQAHEWGKYVGRADFVYRNGKFELERYQLLPVNLNHDVADEQGKQQRRYYTEQIEQDPKMLALLTPYQDRAKAQLAVPVGKLDKALAGGREKVRYVQTGLGQLVLAGFIEQTHADIGVLNGGGLRDSLKGGVVRTEDILRVLPFSSTVIAVDMTGDELAAYLDKVTGIKPGVGGYAQLRNVRVNAKAIGLKRYIVKGKPLSAKQTYRVATSSFSANGGDGHPVVTKMPTYYDTGMLDSQALLRYVQKHTPLKAASFAP